MKMTICEYGNDYGRSRSIDQRRPARYALDLRLLCSRRGSSNGSALYELDLWLLCSSSGSGSHFSALGVAPGATFLL